MADEESKMQSGYVAIIGRPNVGKSTLLNQLLGQKISITSRKPQTTRHRILGVQTLENTQIIFVDTPGIHLNEHRALNRHMNQAARNTLNEVDVILFVVEGLKWTEEDEWVLSLLQQVKQPVILLVNKSDLLLDKTVLLPYLKTLSEKHAFLEIIPLSAKRGTNLDPLKKILLGLMPEGPHYFPENQVTDRSDRFRVAELIREKLIRALGEELPYSTTVVIESFQEEEKLYKVQAVIWVEREGQKPIVIGRGGERLKEIGTRARKSLETLLGKKVHLRLWVKVRGGWSDNERDLERLGYIDLN